MHLGDSTTIGLKITSHYQQYSDRESPSCLATFDIRDIEQVGLLPLICHG